MQSLSPSLSLIPKPVSFQIPTSFSIADWRTELLKGSPCFVPRANRIYHFPRQLVRWRVDQCTIFRGQMYCSLIEWFQRDLQIASCFDRCHPHVRSPLSALLGDEFVRHKVVCCLECFYGSCLVRTLVPIKHGFTPVVSHPGEEFVKLWKTSDRPVVLWICHVSSFVDHCDHIIFHELGAMEYCLVVKLRSHVSLCFPRPLL